jgi:hypothetical protein
MKSDFESLGLKEDKLVYSSSIQYQILDKEMPLVEGSVDIDTINMLLKQLSTQDITKRSVWNLFTKMKRSKEVPNVYTFEWLLYFFGSRLKDPKATRMIYTKLSQNTIPFRHETFVRYVDALAETMGDQDLLNRVLHKYRTNSLMPKLGEKEDFISSLLKYWVNHQKPNPCFKLLHLAQKNQLELSVESIRYLLDACYLFNGSEPIAGQEIMEPVITNMADQGSTVKLLDLLIAHYGKYASIDNILRIWNRLEPSQIHSQLSIESVEAILYAFGATKEISKTTEFIKLLNTLDPNILKGFMNGYLDQYQDPEELTRIIQQIRIDLQI